jgi:3-oxo-5-alpha-steroid 4-dehydrogenase 1
MQTVHTALIVFIFVMSALTWWSTSKRANRYGRYMKEGQKSTVSARIGWLMFESPQVVAFAATFWLTAGEPSVVAIAIFVVWQAHYVHRAVLYPLRRKADGKRFPIGGVVAGFVFNGINGFLNGYAVAMAGHLADSGWLTDPRFLVGTVIFVAGWLVNFHGDSVLIGLRSDGFTGYRVPTGGLFRWVSCANYTGEIVMWCGFALATWTVAGLSFAVFTIANLLPRALTHHKWYLKNLPDYPSNRKALFPGLL